MQSQTKVFSDLAKDYMNADPLAMRPDDTARQAVAALTDRRQRAAMVVGDDGRLHGILTEQDVTRRIAMRCTGDEALADVMTAPVVTVEADDYVFHAIARMRRAGWRHLPVIDDAGRPVGMLELDSVLARANGLMMELIDDASRERSLPGLHDVKVAQIDLVDRLLADSVPAPEILALISHINSDIHHRIVVAHLAAMREEGLGEPPVRFCGIIMGSGGRGESYLYPDQDNGFILDDYPDADHDAVDRFFIDLAERMTASLDEVGIPFCRGFVMATNPVWRKNRTQWREQITYWGRKRSTIAVQYSDIFFDFRGFYGDLHMASELRRLVTGMAKSSPAFLAEVQKETSQSGVALGWFGRLSTERDVAEHKGKVNLKHRGTLPLISSLRLLCLREGVEAVPTLDRIAGLHAAGVLSHDEQDYLSGAFRHITQLLLGQQVADGKAGRPVSNYVHPRDLTERDADILIDSLQAIESFQERVTSEFTGELF